MLRPVALALFLSGLCPRLPAQPAKETAPTQTVQLKDVKIPKIQSKPRIEEFLNGHSRSDMFFVDDFRQPGSLTARSP